MSSPPEGHRPMVVGFVLIVLIAGAAMFIGSGAAAMVEVGNTTVSVNEDTDTVYVNLNNTNTTTNATVDVTFDGIEDAGTENESSTQLEQQTGLTVQSSDELLVESGTVNGTLYDQVRIVVEVDNSTVSSDELSVDDTGTFQKVSGGGGGGLLGGLTNTQLGIGAALIVGLFLLMPDD